MRKIAIFVEGQSEQIFVRNILYHISGNVSFSFECIKIHGGIDRNVPYAVRNHDSQIFFLIINVENDSKVLSFIKEREKALFEKGYNRIIGLRDMYSLEYRKRSKDKIDLNINENFIKAHDKIICSMSSPENINFFFSIMEFEAWLLGMHTIFEKIDDRLSVELIQRKLDILLDQVDPETAFFHPAAVLDKIFNLVDMSYNKKYDDLESITSKIELDDIAKLVNSGGCLSFASFYKNIKEEFFNCSA
ncbi:MAG: DUF4276 family protein [Candidatus Electrothrix sp. Rat3]|nr:DUF4276 family protein [Candidatus Electrothrix rattekaaiensis]